MIFFNHFQKILLPVTFVLLWSSGYIFAENGLRYADSFAFLSLRLWLAWLVISVILLFQRSKQENYIGIQAISFSRKATFLVFKKPLKKIFMVCLTGLFSQAVYSIFFFTALNYKISPGILSIILGVQPLLTLLMMKESMKTIQIIGIFFGFFGLSLTVFNSIDFNSNALFGIISALFSLFGMTIGTILQKKYCSDVPLSLNLFIQYLTSALIVSLICIITGNTNVALSFSFIISLLWLSLIISVAAVYAFYTLLKYGKTASVAAYFYCIPPVTAIMDYIIFNHKLPLTVITGMVLVMIGLILLHYKQLNFFGINVVKEG